MAHFRGEVRGNRGETSRLGSKYSGIEVIANGWDMGVKVIMEHEEGIDVARVYKTGGSNNPGQWELITRVDDV